MVFKMGWSVYALCWSLLTASIVYSDSNSTTTHSKILSGSGPFNPPMNFVNRNIQQTYDFSKSYVRISATISFENIASSAQTQYYIPFGSETLASIGGIQAKVKGGTERCSITLMELDPSSPFQLYQINLTSPLPPKSKQVLQLAYTIRDALAPIPKAIAQSNAQQYLQANLSAQLSSCYATDKQSTIMRFPSANIPDFTIIPNPASGGKEFPDVRGRELTYGPWLNVPPNSLRPVEVRYEYTHPLAFIPSLIRNIEVSHWGGNVAFEEHYELTNLAARLSKQFSRTEFQKSSYYTAGYSAPTTALKGLGISLPPGTLDAYFTDDIGNVSTSRFRSNEKEAMFEIRPRYPLFGEWRYKFRIGWDNNLNRFLRTRKGQRNSLLLQVPFIEGPRNPEGTQYGDVQVNVILPEGATNVKYAVPAELQTAILSDEITTHSSFLDTLGRTNLRIRARNLNDEMSGKNLLVTYDYDRLAGTRKPFNILLLCLILFFSAGLLKSKNYSIGAKTPG